MYGALAVYYFAPPGINALSYKARIYGHYWLERAGSQEVRLNYESTMHYDDYKVGDGRGNLANRQGIRLGEPGVKVLGVIEPLEVGRQQKGERESMARQRERLPLIRASKTGYSMLRPKQGTAIRILQLAQEKGLRTHDEVLSLLADTYRLYEQLEAMLVTVGRRMGTGAPLETLRALLAAEEACPMGQAVWVHMQQRWGVSLEEIDTLFQEAARLAGAGEKPVSYLSSLLSKQVHYQQGPKKRQQHYQQIDFRCLSLTQLKAMRIPEATNERIRRAVDAIMQHNRAAQHALDRWFIRPKEVKALVGGRGELISAYLREHQQEIERHHREFQLTEKYNDKPFSITEQVHLPEYPTEGQAVMIDH